jgi:hypothetical protein
VTGSDGKAYYTNDHYRSFQVIQILNKQVNQIMANFKILSELCVIVPNEIKL